VEDEKWYHAIDYLVQLLAPQQYSLPNNKARWLELAKSLFWANDIEDLDAHIRTLAKEHHIDASLERIDYLE
jgi:hypothetical protein